MLGSIPLKLKTSWILPFILGILYLLPVTFIGTLRFGEIFFILLVFLFPLRVWNQFRKVNENRVFIWLLLLSLILIVTSSFVNKSSQIGVIKGGANILFTLTSFLGAFYFFKGHRLKLISFLFGLIISDYLFGYFILREGTYETVMQQEARNSQFFDLFIVPKLIPLIIALGLIWKDRVFRMIMVGLIVGMIGLVLNARSFGLLLIISCGLCVMSQMKVEILRRSLVLLIPVLFYLVYAGYRDAASRGHLGDQSRIEIREGEKLGGSLSALLLSIGRPDPLVALLAIEDSPILGHGSYSPNGIEYVRVAETLNILSESRSNQFLLREENSIPSHSVLLQSIVEGGILAGVVWIYVIVVMIRVIYRQFSKGRENHNYQFVILYTSVVSLWGILLSPFGFARFDLPVYWVVLIAHLNNVLK